ncbi:MAG: hypothetical protein BWY22_02083 [Bacteroidetes bacterium ADurb.Bin217]|nr:MAG: hypothetical protein BWY22_02083 [Bacteroidetes bacterium ADurb.Bin217]
MMKKIQLTKIELDAQGTHLVANCTIESNHVDALLIIDTGASKSVFDSSYLQQDDFVYIETETLESSQLTEMVSGSIIQITSLCIGGIVFNNFEALAMSLNHVNSLYSRFASKPIVGLIGGDFLNKHAASISYKTMMLTIY